jgi:hypothetical protein
LVRWDQEIRTTLDIDDDVVAAAHELAASERRSLGAVICALARRGLTPARVETAGGLPADTGSRSTMSRWTTRTSR